MTSTMIGRLERLTKRYGDRAALAEIDLEIPAGCRIGLVGLNRAGKTSLLHQLTGLVLPTSGTCEVFGTASADLGSAELSRIGVVYQENRFVDWMMVKQHIRFIGSYYETWAPELEAHLAELFELDMADRVKRIEAENRQKLAVLLAVCHRPRLLLMDEPLPSLEPGARNRLLKTLFEQLDPGGMTAIISSCVSTDLDQIIDRLWVLERGHKIVDDDLEKLAKRFQEWKVRAGSRPLPKTLADRGISEYRYGSFESVMAVDQEQCDPFAFEQKYGLVISGRQPLDVGRMFPFLVGQA